MCILGKIYWYKYLNLHTLHKCKYKNTVTHTNLCTYPLIYISIYIYIHTYLYTGGCIRFFTGSYVEFDNDIFFYVVLPPIIFSAGMSLKKKMFFRYISLITLFGVVGTVINFCLITGVTYHFTRIFSFKDNNHDKPINLSWEHSMLLAAVLSGTGQSIVS